MRSRYMNQQLVRIIDFGDPFYQGVIALCDIPEGMQLAWVEKQEFIVYELPDYYEFDRLTQQLELDNEYEKVLFAVYLAYVWLEEQSGKFEKEKQYIRDINCEFNTLINWTEEELSWLGNSELMAQTIQARNKVFRQFNQAKRLLTQIINQEHKSYQHRFFTDCVTLSRISDQLLLRMYTIIQSRAMYFPSKHDSLSDIGALVPIIEYFNHSKHNQVFVEIKGDRYVARANRAIKKNQQLFVKYGDHSDEELLKCYGFIEEELGSSADRQANARQSLANAYKRRRKT